MTPAPPIRRLTEASDAALTAVERTYVAALPSGERKPVAWLRSLPARPDYHLLFAGDAGFAVLYVPPDPADAALLEYLAVDAAARGGGVGGRLFAAAGAAAARPVLVEVEAGDPDADRRRAFYRRHGCRALVGLEYTLPLPGAPPMGLMVARADTMSRSDLARWLATVYADVYGQGRDDPRVATMVAGVADPVQLE